MGLQGKALNQVTIADLQELISGKVRENVTLEFKREMYKGTDSDKREMLRDLVSLANAEGGFLVLGMEEDDKGQAKTLHPVINSDTEAARLVSTALTGISERIPGLRAMPIPVPTLGHVIVVQVP